MITLAAGTNESWAITWSGLADLVAAISLLGGIFFMVVGAVGVFRMPDAYHRMHAASKCTTLGLTGMLVAACIHVGDGGVYSKSIITIVFTFIATPIGTHLLAKAAHLGGAECWEKTLSDEYAEDKAASVKSSEGSPAPGGAGPD